LHEGGLLAFALHAAARGWGILYLGPNTPMRDLLAAADSGQVSSLALSITAPSTRASRRALIDKLASWRNKQPGRRVWLGGRGVVSHQAEFAGAGLEVVSQARELEAAYTAGTVSRRSVVG
jgi:methanogenic corrinoid protein MtbC1